MKKNNKGFTLMEMLIVVAIIAILVAIAIPTFTAQLEKSREATDAANIRAKYAEITAAYLSLSKPAAIDSGYEVTLTQSKDGWESGISLPSSLSVDGSPKANGKATLTCDINGNVKCAYS